MDDDMYKYEFIHINNMNSTHTYNNYTQIHFKKLHNVFIFT